MFRPLQLSSATLWLLAEVIITSASSSSSSMSAAAGEITDFALPGKPIYYRYLRCLSL